VGQEVGKRGRQTKADLHAVAAHHRHYIPTNHKQQDNARRAALFARRSTHGVRFARNAAHPSHAHQQLAVATFLCAPLVSGFLCISFRRRLFFSYSMSDILNEQVLVQDFRPLLGPA